MQGGLVLFVVAIGALAANAEKQSFETLLNYYNKESSDGIRIIDGSPASAGQFPWQVAVFFRTASGSFFCGGSLISESYVLTAGHCALGATSFTLYLGGTTLAGSEQGRITVTSTTAIVHAGYNTTTLNNDIALIRLPQAVAFTDRIQPVALASSDFNIAGGAAVTVSGWGRTMNSTTVSQTLNYVQLTTITNLQCATVYGTSVIIDSTICAVGNPHHSTCSGDSGGPLVVYDGEGVATHVGVVSFVSSAGCASGNPSGYVRTSALREWIRENSGV